MGKLVDVPARVLVSHDELRPLARAILLHMGCTDDVAALVADHLVDADLAGVSSHGVLRLVQYTEQAHLGHFTPSAVASVQGETGGCTIIDGHDGFGIPA